MATGTPRGAGPGGKAEAEEPQVGGKAQSSRLPHTTTLREKGAKRETKERVLRCSSERVEIIETGLPCVLLPALPQNACHGRAGSPAPEGSGRGRTTGNAPARQRPRPLVVLMCRTKVVLMIWNIPGLGCAPRARPHHHCYPALGPWLVVCLLRRGSKASFWAKEKFFFFIRERFFFQWKKAKPRLRKNVLKCIKGLGDWKSGSF